MRDGRLNTVVASFYNRAKCEQSVSGSDCVERFGCDFGFQNLLSFKRSFVKSSTYLSFASLLF